MNALHAATGWGLALWTATAVAATDAPAGGAWRFEVLLDGAAIGEHSFVVSARGAEREAQSVASFDVKLLGINVYRYRHTASETWRDGCLASLQATTDDDGETVAITANTRGDRLELSTPTGKQSLQGCVMTFAYWNPAIQKQSHLLNPQTGRYEQVQISRIGEARIEVRGRSMAAQHLRITGPEQPIDLWYSPQGEWLALESTVTGGRKLSYRLK